MSVHSEIYMSYSEPGAVISLARIILSRYGTVTSEKRSEQGACLISDISSGILSLGTVTVTVEAVHLRASVTEVTVSAESAGLFPGRAGSEKRLHSLACELFTALDRERVPEVGQEVYVDSTVYIEFPEQDFIGGLARISGVSEDRKTIEVEEDPGGSFRWEKLMMMQTELRDRFSSARARRCHQ